MHWNKNVFIKKPMKTEECVDVTYSTIVGARLP